MQTNEIDNETLNRWIHEKLLGECWHPLQTCEQLDEFEGHVRYGCHLCGDSNAQPHSTIPDYCSDLNLAAKAEAKVIEGVGFDDYFDALLEVTNQDENPITATARQRCLAMYSMAGNEQD